ncbi:hypothetical protein ACQUQU_00435 [Thalassolituus sp. LLYu03]|uniref:hypothetical protein n=1 Tax=Thalassolituus sp. LLYu03 TaxID=3421656 RepID=UPI003D2AE520
MKLRMGLLVLMGLSATTLAESEYQQWLKKTQTDFQSYLDENDKAFIQFLKQKWQPVDVKPAEQRDPAPKPEDLPAAPVNKVKVEQPRTPVVTLRPLPPVSAPDSPPVTQPVTQPATSPITGPQPSRQPGSTVQQPTIPVQTPVISVQKPTLPFTPVQPSTPVTEQPAGQQPATPVAKAPAPATPVTTPGSKPVTSPITKPVTSPIPTPVTPPSAPPAAAEKPATGPAATFDFYGDKISIHYAATMKKAFSGKLNNDNIANYWLKLAGSEHKQTVKELKDTAAALGLNDWGTAQLFDAFARSLQRDNNSRILTSWFLLVKAGYDARVAYNDRVHLLITSDQELFGVTYFRLGGKQYYAVNLNDKPLKPGKVFTYEGQHEEGSAALDFSEPNRFVPTGAEEQRKLAFSYDGKQYNLSVAYPQRYVAYFASYPQLSLPNYFRAGLPAVTAQSLLTQLRPVVEGQSELDAVNRLLRFVQTAFSYETDDDQFHEENYLFPLETLHYPYSDCEDRAALFAWLTESLLGLDVVILDYPGHVATAVAFSAQIKGDSWTVGGKRFVIADPTYINADAGMTMPQFAGVQPKIVRF